MSRPPAGGGTDPADLVSGLRAARERAVVARDELHRAWTSGGERTSIPAGAMGDLVDAIAAVTMLAENTSDPELNRELTAAAANARWVRTVTTRNGETQRFRPLFPGEKASLLWASDTVAQLNRRLEAAERHTQQPGLFHPSTKRGRVTVLNDFVPPPGTGMTAADLVLPPGSLQSVEITLPGTFLWLTVVLLPASCRGRYHEEFRAELRDLPSNQHLGYAMRQCFQALALRRGLMAGRWTAWWIGRRAGHDQESEGG